MKKIRYSIECIKEYNSDAKDFLLVQSLNQTISNLGIDESEFTVTCLIDDLTYQVKNFDFNNYGLWMAKQGVLNCSLFYESWLTAMSNQLLGKLDLSAISQKLIFHKDNNVKYASPMFIATWFLARLGYIDCGGYDIMQAERLINILPSSFKIGENQAIQIIAASELSIANEQIQYIYV